SSVTLHLYEFGKRRALAEQAAAKTPPGGAALRDVTPAMAGNAEKAAKPEKTEKKKKAGGILGKIDSKIAKYEALKKKTKDEAEDHEKARNEHRLSSLGAQRHSKELTLALAVLQVAIALASISVLAKKKPLWFASMIIGAYGVFQTFNGIFLWYA